MNCLNCGSKLTCGCQKKTASDGKQVCSSCLQSYETALNVEKEQKLETLKLYTNEGLHQQES
jgi:hypothetical protein